ncbi:MAG TPA: hypothetical protein VGB83_07310 [Actinomycetota bacterium]
MGRAFRRSTGAAVAILVLVLTFPSLALAQASPVKLEVTAGYNGFLRGWASNPFEIAVEADSLFAGKINLTFDPPNQSAYTIPIEVPGGSRKVVRIVVPRASVREVTATDQKGRVIARERVQAATLSSGEDLVGVLSPDPVTLAQVPVPIVDRDARVVELTRETLALGAPALRPLSHLVVDGSIVARLTGDEVQAIRAFAIDGGELILAAGSPDQLALVPGGWAPRGSDAVAQRRVGTGVLTVAALPFSDAAWSENGSMWPQVMRPSESTRWHDGAEPGWTDVWLNGVGAQEQRRLRWMGFFVLGYALLAGPVTFGVLTATKKRPRAWVVIPSLALVVAVVIVVAAGARGNADERVVSGYVEWYPEGTRQHLAVGLVAPGSGLATFRLPGDGVVEPSIDYSAATRATREVTPGPSSTSVTLPLSSGQAGVVRYRNAAATGGVNPAGTLKPGKGIVGMGTFFGGKIPTAPVLKGTITNPTPYTLRNVTVVAGHTGAAAAEALGPGSSRRVALTYGGPNAPASPSGYPGYNGFAFGPGGYYDPSGAIAGVVASHVGIGRHGDAYLTGWVDAAEATGLVPLGASEGEILVVIPLDVDLSSAHDVPSDTVRGRFVGFDGTVLDPDPFGSGSFDSIRSNGTSIIRYRLPPDSSPANLYVQRAGRSGRFPSVPAQPLVRRSGGSFTIVGRGFPGSSFGPGYTFQGFGAGTAKRPNVEFYDFTTGAWVSGSVQQSSVVRVAAAGLINDLGEVYVRLSGSSPYNLTSDSVELSAA